MGFWIFLAVCCLLIPIVMIGFGRHFLKHPPKDINDFYGYRTSMSRLNQDTWDFAHTMFGRLWVKWGWICMILTVILLIPGLFMSEDTLGFYVIFIEIIQLAFLLIPIIPVERALKQTFDREGNRITP